MTTLITGDLSYGRPWGYPYYASEGATGSDLVPSAFPVAIAGHPYEIDEQKYRRTTMQIRRLQTDDSVEPGENSLNATGLWPRAQDNFFQGAGQLFLDNRFAFESVYVHSGEYPSVRTRYWRSKGLNPWTENAMSLHQEQGVVRASANANLLLVATVDALYVSDGTDVFWSTNPEDPSPTWTSSGIGAKLGSDITGLATDGHRVWACDSAHGIAYSDDQGTSATHLESTYHATNLWYAKGFLLATTGRDLVEINADGTNTLIWTHPAAAFVWNSATETPSCILVAGNAGSVAFIGSLQADAATEGATLAVPYSASSLPPGETINDLAYSAGFVLLATSEGIRSGTRPDSTGVFDVNPVIEDPGNVQCVVPWHEFCYFGWTAYSTEDDQIYPTGITSSGLGRADLSQYTNPGIPAYATDVMAEDGSSAGVTAVAMLNGVPYFALEAVGVYGPTGNVVESGAFQPGWVRYGTLETKIVCASTPYHGPLLAGQSVNVQMATDAGTILNLGTSNAVGSVQPESPFGGALAVGMKFMPIITLTRGTDTTQGPTLHAWIDKSMVVPPRQDEIVCPILLRSKEESINVNSRPWRIGTFHEFDFLKGLESAGAPVLYQEGTASLQVYIDQVQMAPESFQRIVDEFGDQWFEGVCTVKMITLQIST